MAVEILMPELGESVHEGTVSRWLKKVGDFVKEDESVVEIMTDKVNTELPSPASGILTKIIIQEGENVEVFKAMGIIEAVPADGAVPPTPAAPSEATASEKTSAEPVVPPASKTEPATSETGERQWLTPVVRSMAKEKGVTDAALASIHGTGEGGRITKRDLEDYLTSGPTVTVSTPLPKPAIPSVAGPDQELVPLVGMRKMIAEHMVRSSQIPTVTTVIACDVTSMVKFRELNKESFPTTHGVKLTYTPFFIKALAEALLESPIVNAALMPDNKIAMNKAVHMGVAVSLGPKGEDGLIVPVIRDAHKKGLIEIAKDLEALAKAARSNSLKPADVQGGTFTLTNPGTYGALFGTPMINAPQAGILGVYGITKQPVVIDDMIAIRSIMHIVLTYDHRIIDGSVAGKFLASVRDKLQKFDFFK